MATLDSAGINQTAEPKPNPEKKTHSGYNRAAYTSPPERVLSCRVIKKYGAVEIEFGVTAPFTPENATEQETNWFSLYGQVNEMHERWAREALPHVPFLNRNEKPETVKMAATVMYTEADKHGLSWRKIKTAEGSRFGKYGLVVDDAMWIKMADELGVPASTQFHSMKGVELEILLVEGRGEIVGYKIPQRK